MVETPEVVVDETMIQEAPTLPPEPTVTPTVATSAEAASDETTSTEVGETGPDGNAPAVPITPEAEVLTATDEAVPKKPRKLKVKVDALPRSSA